MIHQSYLCEKKHLKNNNTDVLFEILTVVTSKVACLGGCRRIVR
jgi:hypothetical protein